MTQNPEGPTPQPYGDGGSPSNAPGGWPPPAAPPSYGGQPGGQPPFPGAQPPQFGSPPQPYGAQPPPYGQAPQYGQPPPYGQAPQPGQAPQYGAQPPYPPPYQAPRRRGPGRTIAIVLGVIVLLFVVGLGGLIALGLAVGDGDGETDASSSSSGSSPASGSQAASTSPTSGLADGQRVKQVDLDVGDCVRSKTKGDVSDLDVVDCTESHDGEVTGVYRVSGGSSYPGEDVISAEAEKKCAGFAPDNLADSSRDDLQIYYIYPREATWAVGDREVQCLVVGTAPLTSKLADL